MFEHKDLEPYGHFTLKTSTNKISAIDTASSNEFLIDPVAFAYDFGARMYDARLGIFTSIDPLSHKYPQWSPYVAFANNPIYFVDKVGKENVVYLVILPSAKEKLKNGDAQKIANAANQYYQNLGLKTEVRVFNQGNFDYKNLDKTDAVAAIGNVDELKEFAITKVSYGAYKDIESWEGGFSNPEKSSNTYYGNKSLVAIDINAIDRAAKEVSNTDKNNFAGFLITHGSGHNAGKGDSNAPCCEDLTGTVMTGGDIIQGMLQFQTNPDYKKLEDFTTNPANEKLKGNFMQRFGDNQATDNYSKNKKENEKQK